MLYPNLYVEVTISMSKNEYSVQESDMAAIVKVLKDTEVASPLGVIVNTWTLQEAAALGYLPQMAATQGNKYQERCGTYSHIGNVHSLPQVHRYSHSKVHSSLLL